MDGTSTTVCENGLVNLENYGPYVEFIYTGQMRIDVARDITKETWSTHYNSILNIMRDGIETDFVQKSFITLDFGNIDVELSIVDYWLNLIMWYLLIRTDTPIKSKHLFFSEEFKKNTIKNYVDEFFIIPNRKKYSNIELNNIIDDMMHLYQTVDEFSFYLANTINFEDMIELMENDPESDDILHADLSNVPLEDVKSVGMDKTNKLIDRIKKAKSHLGYEHCMADAFRASECIKPRQFKEYAINIGSKPDGQGGVFPVSINRSFINGGVSDPVDYFIESSTGRTAQILQKTNVGNSGAFARLLGLNNGQSFLNSDPNYICDTVNFMKVTIVNKEHLIKLDNRYYRLSPNGMERKIRARFDSRLIGQTIYLRSPMTCASAARGNGICYRCYGDLAYSVQNVNIGRIASDILSSVLTQILLSAKHLLETSIEKIVWCSEFSNFFFIEDNMISLIGSSDDSSSINLKEWKLIINPESIELETDTDDIDTGDDMFENIYNESITSFSVMGPDGKIIDITNDKNEKLYISNELNTAIRKKAEPEDDMISISFADITEIPLFFFHIQNNDLTKTLNQLKALLNKSSSLQNLDIHQWLQAAIETVIAGTLSISSVHLETIMSNQIVSPDDSLSKPEWRYPNEPYKLVTLNTALTDNASVTISITYQKIYKMLYNPLTFKKRGASFMDLFFMKKPQLFIRGLEEEEVVHYNENGLIEPLEFFDDSKNAKK